MLKKELPDLRPRDEALSGWIGIAIAHPVSYIVVFIAIAVFPKRHYYVLGQIGRLHFTPRRILTQSIYVGVVDWTTK